ncbi:MAG TPA: SDR family NAD(P)-dependent oxidoreductase [Vicinamibacteria bacterium]|nr:SDR family NAD(P)-dependent oxidoreductase [Vicinamibacteria bacterium]
MKAVLLGATKGMGRALARLLATRGDPVFLLGRNLEDLRKSAQDLESRAGRGAVGVAHCDLEHPMSYALALQAADDALGGFDTVVVSAGLFGTQEQLEEDPALLARVLDANFRGTILFCEAARKRLLARGGGTLCVFSSVAGERGRKPVGLYGATKAGLSHYLESLDHRYRAAGLRTVCVKPGFVKTSMTAGLPAPPFAGEPEAVARSVLRAIERGAPVVYAPPIWALVMLVVRGLPRFVMRRVGF